MTGIATASYAFTGLQASQAHEFQVQAICAMVPAASMRPRLHPDLQPALMHRGLVQSCLSLAVIGAGGMLSSAFTRSHPSSLHKKEAAPALIRSGFPRMPSGPRCCAQGLRTPRPPARGVRVRFSATLFT